MLTRTDLNLLVAFDLLAEEVSVTRAARRAGVSQSAMSHTLRRLRDVFDDALLVRVGGGMVLTPRAEALAPRVRGGLMALGRAVANPEAFEPATTERAFRLASPDLFDLLAMPHLMRRLNAEAPGARLEVVDFARRAIATELASGDVDVAVQPRAQTPGSAHLDAAEGALVGRNFRGDIMRCFVRTGHPVLNVAWTVDAFIAYPHVLVSPTGRGAGPVDAALSAIDRSRRIGLRVPSFATAIAVTASSDLVLTAPEAVEGVAKSDRLASLTPPLPVRGHAVSVVWHPRFSDDPAHRWFRELVIATARAVGLGR